MAVSVGVKDAHDAAGCLQRGTDFRVKAGEDEGPPATVPAHGQVRGRIWTAAWNLAQMPPGPL